MAPDHAPPPKKKPERGKDTAGHEFAGEGALTERIAPPRPAPTPQGGRHPPRPPHVPPPPAPPRAPDPSIAGSKYFTSAPSRQEPRQMSSTRRERSTDNDASDWTLEEDLGDVTRRRERERAAQSPTAEEAPSPPPPPGGGTGKDLDAEARPRELDFSAPNMPRKRRF